MALEIKEGRSYMDASGDEVGPMEFDNRTSTPYVWDCLKTGRSYTRDGKYSENGSETHLNLVSEIRTSIEGPIPIVTRRIIEDGQSGAISWKGHADGSIWIAVSVPGAIRQYVQVNKSELTNVGLIISQLAEFLDEDNGDE